MSGPSSASTLRRLIEVSPPPWRRLGLAIVLGIAASGATIALLAGSGALVDKAATRPGLGAIAGLLAVVEVIAILRAPLRYAERLSAHDAGFRALARWRVWLFDRLEPLSPARLRMWRSGDVARRAVADVDSLQDLYLRGVSPLVQSIVVAALAVSVTGVLVPEGALVLGVALLVALLGAPAIAWRSRPTDAEREAAGSLAADVVDLVHGAPELVAFGRAGAHLGRIERSADVVSTASARRSRATGAAGALVGVCAAIAVSLVLVLALHALRTHRLEPIMLAVLPFTALGSFEVVAPLGAAALGAAEVLAAGRRLLQLADLPAPVEDPPSALALPSGPVEVRLEGATLRYEPGRAPAFEGLDLAFGPGSTTALVGPSGAGKSSVVHALLRYWPLESGSASVGGIAIERVRQDDVRALIAAVDQDAHVFAGSIRDNVVLGRPDASDADVERALEVAQLREWVAGLPEGIATEVGERGAQLSGGQRQRVALARALVAERPVVLLDEPTSGLDARMAVQVLQRVLEASSGRAVLVISHRDEEVAHLDTVLEMADGRIVDRRRGPDQAGEDG